MKKKLLGSVFGGFLICLTAIEGKALTCSPLGQEPPPWLTVDTIRGLTAIVPGSGRRWRS